MNTLLKSYAIAILLSLMHLNNYGAADPKPKTRITLPDAQTLAHHFRDAGLDYAIERTSLIQALAGKTVPPVSIALQIEFALEKKADVVPDALIPGLRTEFVHCLLKGNPDAIKEVKEMLAKTGAPCE